MHQKLSKRVPCGATVVLALLALLVTIAVARGVTSAGADAEVNESATLRLISNGPASSPLKGFARLALRVSQTAGDSFRASVEVEGDGLVESRLYAMWLAAPDGNTLLIDTARADEDCDEDPETGDEIDCETVLDLRARLVQTPFHVVTLEGLTVNVREHAIGTEAVSGALLTGTVTFSNLKTITLAGGPPNVGDNIGSPVDDDPPDSGTGVSSPRRPPNVGRNSGSPFDDDEDEERRRDEGEV